MFRGNKAGKGLEFSTNNVVAAKINNKIGGVHLQTMSYFRKRKIPSQIPDMSLETILICKFNRGPQYM